MTFLIPQAIALACYLAAASMHVRAALAGDDPPRHARWFAAVGAAIHGLTLVGEVWVGYTPGFSESLSAVALGIMVVVAGVDPRRLASLGAFLGPAGVLLMTLSFLAPSAQVQALSQSHDMWWLPIHLGLVFAAVAGFVTEFVVSGLQAVVRRRLKRKQLAGLHRFPALDVLDSTQQRALVFGLACMGLGILVGAVGASSMMHHQAWVADPKVWVTVVVWAWYGGVLFVRRRMGWHSRWSLALSAVGFGLLLFSWVGLEFLVGGFHAYGA